MSRDPDIQTMQLRELDELTAALEEIRRKYDQYFIGIEKREPGPERDRFERALLKTKLLRSPLMVVRYKFQQFMARVRTYQSYWDRVLREIEEGTYRRGATTMAERQASHLADAAIRRAQGVEAGPELEDDAPIEARRIHNTAKSAEAFLASLLGEEPEKPARAKAAAPAAPSRPAAPVAAQTSPPRAPPPPPVGPVQLDSERPPPIPRTPPPPPPRAPTPADPVASLFDEYVGARRARGEDVSKITLSSFAKSVQKQVDQARSQLGTDVELKVRVTSEKVSVVALKKK